MSDRPAIPRAIQEELLLECRHRCAVDCEPVALEKAHIILWCETQDHSAPNLIVLCANCHTRSHTENWPESTLRKYKQNPCAIAAERQPVMSPDQKVMVDFVLTAHPDSMTEKERLRFASMTAAYVGVTYSEVKVIAVVTEARVPASVWSLPSRGAEALIAGIQAHDPRLFAFLAEAGGEAGVLRVEAAQAEQPLKATRTDVSEKGLETLIFSSMTISVGLRAILRITTVTTLWTMCNLSTFLQRDTAEAVGSRVQLGSDNPEAGSCWPASSGDLLARRHRRAPPSASSTANTT